MLKHDNRTIHYDIYYFKLVFTINAIMDLRVTWCHLI